MSQVAPPFYGFPSGFLARNEIGRVQSVFKFSIWKNVPDLSCLELLLGILRSRQQAMDVGLEALTLKLWASSS